MRSLSIYSIFEYVIAVVILIFELYLFVSFYRVTIEGAAQNPTYLLLVNNLMIDRLNYCTYLQTNDSNMLFYVPPDANYTKYYQSLYGKKYKRYLENYIRCFYPINTSFMNITDAIDLGNGEFEFKGYFYSMITFPAFGFVGLNKNETYIFNRIYIESQLNNVIYMYLASNIPLPFSSFDLISGIFQIYDTFTALVNSFLATIALNQLYNDLGELQAMNQAIYQYEVQNFSQMIDEAMEENSPMLFLTSVLSVPVLQTDTHRNLFIEDIYNVGWLYVTGVDITYNTNGGSNGGSTSNGPKINIHAK